MPAVASLEQLREVQKDLEELKAASPEAYGRFVALVRKHRGVGYRNVCRLLLGESTPEKLKGEGEKP